MGKVFKVQFDQIFVHIDKNSNCSANCFEQKQSPARILEALQYKYKKLNTCSKQEFFQHKSIIAPSKPTNKSQPQGQVRKKKIGPEKSENTNEKSIFDFDMLIDLQFGILNIRIFSNCYKILYLSILFL